MVAEPRQSEVPASTPSLDARAEARNGADKKTPEPQRLLPGMSEQAPGIDLRNDKSQSREEALFGRGFCFDQIDPLAGFAKVRIDTHRDANGNLKTTSVTSFDNGIETTVTKDAECRTRQIDQKGNGVEKHQEFDQDGTLRRESREAKDQYETFERNYDGSTRRSSLNLKTGDLQIQAKDKNGQPIKDQSEENLVREVNGELQAAAKAEQFSGVIGIAKVSKEGIDTVFTGAVGDANIESGDKNSNDTRFRLASMGKMFTGIAIMQMEEAGQLGEKGLDEPIHTLLSGEVGEYFKTHPKPNGEQITVRDLLEHKAGLGDTFGKTFDEHKGDADFRSLEGQLRRFFQDGKPTGETNPENPPVAGKFDYSNFGFLLLGRIIEEKAHRQDGSKFKDYAEYVNEKIFAPANMTRSGFEPENRCLEGRATNYMHDGAFGLKSADATLPYSGGPAGGGYSTMPDLLKFGQALASGKLFNKPETGEKFLSDGGSIRKGLDYGFGRYNEVKDGIRSIYHYGGSEGMNTAFRYFPDKGYISIVLANRDAPAAEHMDNYIFDRIPGRRK